MNIKKMFLSSLLGLLMVCTFAIGKSAAASPFQAVSAQGNPVNSFGSTNWHHWHHHRHHHYHSGVIIHL
jgi:GH25 family lysozyme M1 (1,4-beta-N-acetylmuramidase)